MSKRQITALNVTAGDWINAQFGVTRQTVKAEVESLSQQKACYVGISLDLLCQFAVEEKSHEENHQLIAMLAIKSCIGKSAYHSISWPYILVRMCGMMHKEDLNEVPASHLDWCYQYASRRKSTSLRLSLCRNWGMAYIPNGKGIKSPFYSFTFSEKSLIRELEKKGITPINMTDAKGAKFF